MKKIVALVVAWLVGVNIFGMLVLNRLNLAPDTAYTWMTPEESYQQKSWNLLDMRMHWDSLWYFDIAKNGYQLKGVEELCNVVFFPMYPILIKLVSFLTLGNLVLAGWLVSSGALLLAALYLYKLAREFHPNVDPELAIVFMLIFPTAFFFNVLYSESVFLLLSLAGFYYCRKGTYWLAAVFGLLAAFTRLTGALLAAPFLLEWWLAGRAGKRNLPKAMLLACIPLGTAAFFAFHCWKFGDFFLFLKVEEWWGRSLAINRDHFLMESSAAVVNLVLDTAFVVVGVTLTALVAWKVRLSYAVYMILAMALVLSTGTLASIGRYILVLFPMYIYLGSLKERMPLYIWSFVSILLLGLDITLFVNSYWVG